MLGISLIIYYFNTKSITRFEIELLYFSQYARLCTRLSESMKRILNTMRRMIYLIFITIKWQFIICHKLLTMYFSNHTMNRARPYV